METLSLANCFSWIIFFFLILTKKEKIIMREIEPLHKCDKYVAYSVHLSMTKGDSKRQKVVNLYEFIDLFYKKQWKPLRKFRASFECVGGEYSVDRIHASILKIDGIGLIAKDADSFRAIEDFLDFKWFQAMKEVNNGKHSL